MLNYGKSLFLLVMLTSVAHAEVFKCLLEPDKVVYQSVPCPSAVKQEIVEIKKTDPRKAAEAEANLKAWEEDFAKREAVREKEEQELQAELYRKRLQSNMPIPNRPYQFHPYYYATYPFYRSHRPTIHGRFFHRH